MASIGMNTPQMKTMAMRTTVAGGMASGMSRKGADRNSPNAENINEEVEIPRNKGSRFGMGEKGNIIAVYASERAVPKKKPARVLPSIIVNNDVGDVRSMLKVPVLLSKGSDTAWMAPPPKNAAIATKPGIAEVDSIVLSMEKAK